MAAQEIEVILARQLADYLSTPVFIVDPDGNLLFYNEPAEGLLAMRFDETGEIPAAKWSTMFQPLDADGQPIPPEGLPLMIALVERRPVHRDFYISSLDGVRRRIGLTAFPIIGHAGRFLGAAAMFWEADSA